MNGPAPASGVFSGTTEKEAPGDEEKQQGTRQMVGSLEKAADESNPTFGIQAVCWACSANNQSMAYQPAMGTCETELKDRVTPRSRPQLLLRHGYDRKTCDTSN